MLSASGTVTQVTSNNGEVNQAPPPINSGTAPDWNVNYLGIVYDTGLTRFIPL